MRAVMKTRRMKKRMTGSCMRHGGSRWHASPRLPTALMHALPPKKTGNASVAVAASNAQRLMLAARYPMLRLAMPCMYVWWPLAADACAARSAQRLELNSLYLEIDKELAVADFHSGARLEASTLAKGLGCAGSRCMPSRHQHARITSILECQGVRLGRRGSRRASCRACALRQA